MFGKNNKLKIIADVTELYLDENLIDQLFENYEQPNVKSLYSKIIIKELTDESLLYFLLKIQKLTSIKPLQLKFENKTQGEMIEAYLSRIKIDLIEPKQKEIDLIKQVEQRKQTKSSVVERVKRTKGLFLSGDQGLKRGLKKAVVVVQQVRNKNENEEKEEGKEEEQIKQKQQHKTTSKTNQNLVQNKQIVNIDNSKLENIKIIQKEDLYMYVVEYKQWIKKPSLSNRKALNALVKIWENAFGRYAEEISTKLGRQDTICTRVTKDALKVIVQHENDFRDGFNYLNLPQHLTFCNVDKRLILNYNPTDDRKITPLTVKIQKDKQHVASKTVGIFFPFNYFVREDYEREKKNVTYNYLISYENIYTMDKSSERHSERGQELVSYDHSIIADYEYFVKTHQIDYDNLFTKGVNVKIQDKIASFKRLVDFISYDLIKVDLRAFANMIEDLNFSSDNFNAFSQILVESGPRASLNFLAKLSAIKEANNLAYHDFKTYFLDKQSNYMDFFDSDKQSLTCLDNYLNDLRNPLKNKINWWETLSAQHIKSTPSSVNFKFLYDGFYYFCTELDNINGEKVNLPLHFKGQPVTDMRVSLDRLLGILRNSLDPNEQINDLNKINLSVEGDWYASVYQGYNHINENMEVNLVKTPDQSIAKYSEQFTCYFPYAIQYFNMENLDIMNESYGIAIVDHEERKKYGNIFTRILIENITQKERNIYIDVILSRDEEHNSTKWKDYYIQYNFENVAIYKRITKNDEHEFILYEFVITKNKDKLKCTERVQCYGGLIGANKILKKKYIYKDSVNQNEISIVENNMRVESETNEADLIKGFHNSEEKTLCLFFKRDNNLHPDIKLLYFYRYLGCASIRLPIKEYHQFINEVNKLMFLEANEQIQLKSTLLGIIASCTTNEYALKETNENSLSQFQQLIKLIDTNIKIFEKDLISIIDFIALLYKSVGGDGTYSFPDLSFERIYSLIKVFYHEYQQSLTDKKKELAYAQKFERLKHQARQYGDTFYNTLLDTSIVQERNNNKKLMVDKLLDFHILRPLHSVNQLYLTSGTIEQEISYLNKEIEDPNIQNNQEKLKKYLLDLKNANEHFPARKLIFSFIIPLISVSYSSKDMKKYVEYLISLAKIPSINHLYIIFSEIDYENSTSLPTFETLGNLIDQCTKDQNLDLFNVRKQVIENISGIQFKIGLNKAAIGLFDEVIEQLKELVNNDLYSKWISNNIKETIYSLGDENDTPYDTIKKLEDLIGKVVSLPIIGKQLVKIATTGLQQQFLKEQEEILDNLQNKKYNTKLLEVFKIKKIKDFTAKYISSFIEERKIEHHLLQTIVKLENKYGNVVELFLKFNEKISLKSWDKLLATLSRSRCSGDFLSHALTNLFKNVEKNEKNEEALLEFFDQFIKNQSLFSTEQQATILQKISQIIYNQEPYQPIFYSYVSFAMAIKNIQNNELKKFAIDLLNECLTPNKENEKTISLKIIDDISSILYRVNTDKSDNAIQQNRGDVFFTLLINLKKNVVDDDKINSLLENINILLEKNKDNKLGFDLFCQFSLPIVQDIKTDPNKVDARIAQLNVFFNELQTNDKYKNFFMQLSQYSNVPDIKVFDIIWIKMFDDENKIGNEIQYTHLLQCYDLDPFNRRELIRQEEIPEKISKLTVFGHSYKENSAKNYIDQIEFFSPVTNSYQPLHALDRAILLERYKLLEEFAWNKNIDVNNIQKPLSKCTQNELTNIYLELKNYLSIGNNNQEKILENEIKLLAVLREMMFRATGKFPFDIQMLPLLLMQLKGGHFLFSIQTGEGKSLISALMNGYLHGHGHTTRLHSSSILQADEDLEKNLPFYQMLGASSRLIESSSPRKTYQKGGIHYTETSEMTLYQAGALYGREELRRMANDTKTIEDNITDEDDVSRLDMRQDIKLASLIPDPGETVSSLVNPYQWLYPLINAFIDSEDFLSNREDNDIHALSVFLANKSKDDNWTEDQKKRYLHLKPYDLGRWLNAAMLVKGLKEKDDYLINIDENSNDKFQYAALIDSGFQSGPLSQLGAGAQQLLHARLDESAKKEHLKKNPDLTNYIPFSCDRETGSIKSDTSPSVYASKKKKGTMIGITGTAGSNVELTKIVENKDIHCYKLPPRLESKREKLGTVYINPWFLNDENDKIRNLIKAIKNSKQKRNNQPILILCDDIESVDRYLKAIREAFPNLGDHIQTADGRLDMKELKERRKKAGMNNMITIATDVFGRGTDIEVNEQNKKDDGLYVINLGEKQTLRQKVQRHGRQGRLGEIGYYQEIFNVRQLKALAERYHVKTGFLWSKKSYNSWIKKIHEAQDFANLTELKYMEKISKIFQATQKKYIRLYKKYIRQEIAIKESHPEDDSLDFEKFLQKSIQRFSEWFDAEWEDLLFKSDPNGQFPNYYLRWNENEKKYDEDALDKQMNEISIKAEKHFVEWLENDLAQDFTVYHVKDEIIENITIDEKKVDVNDKIENNIINDKVEVREVNGMNVKKIQQLTISKYNDKQNRLLPKNNRPGVNTIKKAVEDELAMIMNNSKNKELSNEQLKSVCDLINEESGDDVKEFLQNKGNEERYQIVLKDPSHHTVDENTIYIKVINNKIAYSVKSLDRKNIIDKMTNIKVLGAVKNSNDLSQYKDDIMAATLKNRHTDKKFSDKVIDKCRKNLIKLSKSASVIMKSTDKLTEGFKKDIDLELIINNQNINAFNSNETKYKKLQAYKSVHDQVKTNQSAVIKAVNKNRSFQTNFFMNACMIILGISTLGIPFLVMWGYQKYKNDRIYTLEKAVNRVGSFGNKKIGN